MSATLTQHTPNTTVDQETAAEAAFMAIATSCTLRASEFSWVQAEWFFDPHWAYAWDTALKMLSSGRNVDPTLVANTLRRTYGEDTAHQFYVKVVNARETYLFDQDNASDYIRLVRRSWICRTSAEIAATMAMAAAAGDQDTIIELTYKLSTVLESGTDNEQDSFAPSEANSLLLGDIEALMHDPNAGVLTGITALDDVWGPLKAGRLYVIGAPTSVGKSMIGLSLMLNIAQHFVRLDAARERMGDTMMHQSVEYFSMEMLALDQAARLAANRTREVSVSFMQRGFRTRMSDDPDEAKFARFAQASTKAAKELDGYFQWHQRPKTLLQMRMLLRKAKQEGRLPRVILIDQSEYVRNENGGGELRHWYTEMYQELRAIAAEFKVAVFVLHQFNREADKSSTKIPTLAALKESGGVENAADGAVLLWYPHNHWPGDAGAPEEGEYPEESEYQYIHGMWMIVAKNKQGLRNTWIPMRRDGEFASVASWPEDWDLAAFVEKTVALSGFDMSGVDIYGRR